MQIRQPLQKGAVMREGVTEQEKRDNTNNCAYYKLTCLKRNLPSKAKVSYNLRYCSDPLKAGEPISIYKYNNKHFIRSSFHNTGFKQEYLHNTDVIVNKYPCAFQYKTGTSVLCENYYSSPRRIILFCFVSEHAEFDVAVAFNNGGVHFFEES